MKYKKLQIGFTLIELLVVMAIFTVMSSILLFNYQDFSAKISVENLSQDIALSVRKAQSYATNSPTTGITDYSASNFPAYGISFSKGTNLIIKNVNSPNSKRFVLFADIAPVGQSADKLYSNGITCGTPVSGSECLETFSISTADQIDKLCYPDVSGTEQCFTAATGGTVNVLFRRPSPDASICVVNGTGDGCAQMASYLKVFLLGSKGTVKIITVWNTGQISVGNPPPVCVGNVCSG